VFRSPASIFVALFAVVVVFVAVGSRVGANALEQRLILNLQRDLLRIGRVVDALVRERRANKNWDALADELGKELDVRVTLIDDDGRVLGDSAIAAEQIPKMENHGERPEVSVAREGEIGFSVRHSTSVSERLAYVAIPFKDDVSSGPRLRVVRLARDADDIERATFQTEIAVFTGGALTIALLAIAIWGVSRQRDERVATLRSAVKHSPNKVRTFFRDESAEAKLARAIDESRRSTEDELTAFREQIERQRQILEGMQEGVLVLDQAGTVVFVNRALREMWLLGQDVQGKALLEVVRSGDLQAIVERTQSERAPQAGEIETAGLKPRRLLVQTSPLEADSLVAVFIDVTDVRKLESLRRDFVANVSHELRTPVTAIKSATETLRTSALNKPDDALKFLDIVDRNAQRLADLVEDLLDLSRIESKAYKLSLEPLALPAVAAYCLSLFKERADKKGLVLSSTVGADLANVRADRRALEQVLTNLIDNAVKYCPSGAEIAISAEAHGQTIRITVKDSGPGIEPKHLPRLFERFYRVDPGRARDTGGTGLGLSIAKHLVEAMDGSIGVESTPGQGTAFYVTLARA
jgi:two-component system phosphate regulon sensor histidine kinase PhoR